MRRHLIIIAALLSLFSPAAQAANSTVAAMTTGGAVSDTDLLYCVQSAGTTDRKCTPLQLAAYLFGKVSGDLTCTGVGGCTLKATGPGALGPIGSATVVPIVTIDAQGRVTALSSTTITQPTVPTAANPTATASDTAVNGVAATFLRSDGAPAIQKASSSLFGIAKVDNTTITAAAGVLSAVNTGTVTSVATGCGASGGPITGTGTIIAQALVNPQSGTNYAILGTDCGKLLNLSNAANQIPTIAQAGTAGFLAGYFVQVCNQGAGTQTITPTTSTIGGAATFILPAGSAAAPQCATVISDGTNYQVAPDFTRNAAITIASGTSAMGTGAITSATCATVVTTTATGTATTDVVNASFNGDPTAVTGYIPATAGMLTIIAYPSSGNVNFKVCNNTSSSVTPGAITLNWKVVR